MGKVNVRDVREGGREGDILVVTLLGHRGATGANRNLAVIQYPEHWVYSWIAQLAIDGF